MNEDVYKIIIGINGEKMELSLDCEKMGSFNKWWNNKSDNNDFMVNQGNITIRLIKSKINYIKYNV